MAKDNGNERKFRLRPRKPPARSERRVWVSVYKIIMHHARMSGARKHGAGRLGGEAQLGLISSGVPCGLCTRRIAHPGQWRAHGRYVARESATHEERSQGAVGFNTSGRIHRHR